MYAFIDLLKEVRVMVKKNKNNKAKVLKPKSARAQLRAKVMTAVSDVKNAIKRTVKQQVKKAIEPATQKIEVHVVRKTLGKSPEEHHFILHDGRKLKSLYELVDELETMSEDAFKEYVSDFKNDFANWARDVFHASDLAEEMTHVKNRFETQKAVMKHMLRDVKELVHPVVCAQKTKKCEQTKAGKCVIR